MIIYGIIQQTSDNISCHSVYTNRDLRDEVLEKLQRLYENNSNLYYEFSKKITTMVVK